MIAYMTLNELQSKGLLMFHLVLLIVRLFPSLIKGHPHFFMPFIILFSCVLVGSLALMRRFLIFGCLLYAVIGGLLNISPNYWFLDLQWTSNVLPVFGILMAALDHRYGQIWDLLFVLNLLLFLGQLFLGFVLPSLWLNQLLVLSDLYLVTEF